MTLFLLGLLIFLGVHSISIAGESWRNQMVRRIGEGAWKVLFSLLSIFGFVLIVLGYTLARSYVNDLYIPQQWQRHISLVLLLPVFPLLIATYFPGRIRSAVRHPMLLATQLWAVAHLISNASPLGLLLFSSFLIWAVADLISLRHRQLRPVPEAPAARYNDAIAVVVGLIFYVVFILYLHQLLIGVSVI